MLRVLLADDHPLIRKGIRAVLADASEISVVGEAADGYELRRLCDALQPDVLLLDLQMPGPPAAETVVYLQAHVPRTKIIVLTAYDDDVHIRSMEVVGVAGYVLKDEADEVIIHAITAVACGIPWFSQPVIAKRWRHGVSRRPTQAPALTPREMLILQLVVAGKTNQEISFALSLKEKTIEKYLRDMYVKLGLSSRVDAAVWAVRSGLF